MDRIRNFVPLILSAVVPQILLQALTEIEDPRNQRRRNRRVNFVDHLDPEHFRRRRNDGKRRYLAKPVRRGRS